MQNTLRFNPLSRDEQKGYAGASESARIAYRQFGDVTLTVVSDGHEDSNSISVDFADENGDTLIYAADWNPETLERTTQKINAARSVYEVIYFLSKDHAFTLAGFI